MVLVEIHDIADWLLQRNQSWWRIFVMIRKMQNIDIDRVADIWLKTNLKAHYFIPEQYWTSNYELVKEMMSQQNSLRKRKLKDASTWNACPMMLRKRYVS